MVSSLSFLWGSNMFTMIKLMREANKTIQEGAYRKPSESNLYRNRISQFRDWACTVWCGSNQSWKYWRSKWNSIQVILSKRGTNRRVNSRSLSPNSNALWAVRANLSQKASGQKSSSALNRHPGRLWRSLYSTRSSLLWSNRCDYPASPPADCSPRRWHGNRPWNAGWCPP